MRKFALSSVLALALSVGITAAQADNPAHPNHGHHHSQSPTQSHRCGVVQKGFTVYGDHASSAATQTNGKWNGPFTIGDITRVNHHAKKAGLDPLPFTSPGVTFQLSNAQVIFVGVTDINSDSQVGLDDLQDTDAVKLIGKIQYAKKGGHADNACSDHGFGSDRYDDPDTATIRQVVVHRAPTP